MEDKRTLLAFLIIGLILLLLPYYYEWMGLSSKSPPSAPEDSAPEEERASDPIPQKPAPLAEKPPAAQETLGEKHADIASPIPSVSRDFSPRQIIVRTPLQYLTFSTAGGVLTSCQLLQYRRIDGSQVELVPPGGRGLVLSLTRLDSVQDLSRIEFIPDQEEVFVPEGEERALRLTADLGGGQRLEKVMTFFADRYGFNLDLVYQGFDEDTEALLTWNRGIAFTEKEPEIDLREVRVFALLNEELIEKKVDDDEEDWESFKGALQWAGVRNKYFLTALAPRESGRFRVVLRGRGSRTGLPPDYTYEVGAQLDHAGVWKSLLYLGPLDYDNLIRYGVELDQAIDFGLPIVRQISKFLLVLFKATYSFVPNYGWIIVIFAVVIKILVYPLTHKTYESAAKMQEIQPKIAALREKFKNDNQRLSRETMKLYKEEGVNPLGGCLPLLLQMPIFFALYNLFGKTIELRQAPFILWIQDLSLPDEILLGGFGLHVLPLLMAASMLVQQKMTMKDPKQAFMVYMMPAVMIFIFWKMSSGLVLYWTIFNVLSIGQQLLFNYFKREQPAVAER